MIRKRAKRIQKRKENLKHLLWLKCADCQGFWVDGYQTCPNQRCPLRGMYPPRRVVEGKAFRKEMAFLARQQKNDIDFWTKILPITQPAEKRKKLKKSLNQNRVNRTK